MFGSKIESLTNVLKWISESCFRNYLFLILLIFGSFAEGFTIDQFPVCEHFALVTVFSPYLRTHCFTVSLLELAVGCCALPLCVANHGGKYRNHSTTIRQTTIHTHIHMNSPIPQMHVFGLWEETRVNGENQEPSCSPPPYGTMSF